ncbi:MAG: ATP-binding cassette domain-containing protein, partial [Proteobacteria bacterium]
VEAHAMGMVPARQSIQFQNVSFAYGEELVLRDINVSIPFGQVVALVGPSGAGKSTFSLLVPRFYDPKEGSIHKAITSLAGAVYATDCGTGAQLAEYVAIDNLFGPVAVDEYFKASEFMVADWDNVHASESVTHGNKGRRFADGTGELYASMGKQAIVGASGFIGSVYDVEFLDSISNINENFVVVAATEEGMAARVRNAGPDYYTKLMEQAWRQSQNVSKTELKAMQTLAGRKDLSDDPKRIRNAIPQTAEKGNPKPIISGQAQDLARLLMDPFLNTTEIYVHPMGVRTISWHILRLAQLNSRTPYDLAFYEESTNAEIFHRYIRKELDDCSRTVRAQH